MASTTAPVEEPRIYVACLAAYNNGLLHGAWVDVGDAWTMWEGVRAMLAASPMPGAEEFAIHDYEGFCGISLAEYQGLESVAEMAAFLSDHGTLGAALYEHFGQDLGEAREAMAERYLGAYASLADYMEEAIGAGIEVPTPLAGYIDWEAMARDADLSGDIMSVCIGRDEVHVFCGH